MFVAFDNTCVVVSVNSFDVTSDNFSLSDVSVFVVSGFAIAFVSAFTSVFVLSFAADFSLLSITLVSCFVSAFESVLLSTFASAFNSFSETFDCVSFLLYRALSDAVSSDLSASTFASLSKSATLSVLSVVFSVVSVFVSDSVSVLSVLSLLSAFSLFCFPSNAFRISSSDILLKSVAPVLLLASPSKDRSYTEFSCVRPVLYISSTKFLTSSDSNSFFEPASCCCSSFDGACPFER